MYFIIPNYLLQKKYKAFIVSSFYLIVGAAFIELAFIYYFIVFQNPLFLDSVKEISIKSLDIYLRLLGMLGIVFFASSVKLLKHWYGMQRTNQQLVQEKLEAELNFLKSQVHPHFLFNTLNNLYALTLKKSDQSPEVVLKLSEMLDYMLYQTNEEQISLDKEIQLIENYIALEKLRYGDKVNIEMDVEGRAANILIPPMILFPLVENCFKHGISNDTKSGWIKMKMEVDRSRLSFDVSNSKPPRRDDDMQEVSKGIGLKNVRKRLELIYPNKHSLEISDDESAFSCSLNIKLSD
jgi:LytS/YehU family sensor histidine kinase